MRGQQYARLRNKASLLNPLNRLIRDYARREGIGYECAVRDVLTDARHLCDLTALDYGDIDERAYQVYLEEGAIEQTA